MTCLGTLDFEALRHCRHGGPEWTPCLFGWLWYLQSMWQYSSQLSDKSTIQNTGPDKQSTTHFFLDDCDISKEEQCSVLKRKTNLPIHSNLVWMTVGSWRKLLVLLISRVESRHVPESTVQLLVWMTMPRVWMVSLPLTAACYVAIIFRSNDTKTEWLPTKCQC